LAIRERVARNIEEALAIAERERRAADQPRVLWEHRKAVREVVAALPPLMKANARLRTIVAEYGGFTSFGVAPLAFSRSRAATLAR